MIYAKSGSNWPSGSGEENVKVYRRIDERRTTGDHKKFIWAFSSGEPKKKKTGDLVIDFMNKDIWSNPRGSFTSPCVS
jgi:hypothetical protein